MAIDIEAARRRAVDAIRTFYATEHGPADHITAERNARDAVTFAVLQA